MSEKYLDDHGVETLWSAIKNRFTQKEAGKGLSAEDYTTAEKTKLSGIEAGANAYVLPKASASTLGGVMVGSNLSIDANGVLSASGGGGDGIYVVHVNVNQSFGSPTGDESELMGLREHDNAILDITAPTPVSGHYTAYLSKRTVVNYYFTLFIHDKTENRLKIYIYEVSTSVGRITLDEKFTFVTEEE